MKPNLRTICAIVVLAMSAASLHSPLAWSGQEGHGGDLVECSRHVPETPSQGYYSPDYLVGGAGPGAAVQATSWEASRDRILGLLDQKAPRLAASLRQFVAFMGNTSDPTQLRLWKNARHGLIDLKDEDFTGKIPSYCRAERLVQAVIRTENPEFTLYEYDADRVSVLRREQPLQYSFLMVHEWLWDLTDDVRMIRELNAFLHSSALETTTPAAFALYLKRLAISQERIDDTIPGRFPDVAVDPGSVFEGGYTREGARMERLFDRLPETRLSEVRGDWRKLWNAPVFSNRPEGVTFAAGQVISRLLFSPEYTRGEGGFTGKVSESDGAVVFTEEFETVVSGAHYLKTMNIESSRFRCKLYSSNRMVCRQDWRIVYPVLGAGTSFQKGEESDERTYYVTLVRANP